MTDRFTAPVRREASTAIIDLIGVLDADSGPALGDAYVGVGTEATRIVLNFAPMTFMNSSGIALVVELLARARVEGREVHAVGLSDHYRQIFEITRLSDFVTIHADEASALAR